jgi:hypothetical protein
MSKIKTGLKDKNREEIYVGDKVRFKFYGQHYFIEKVIVFKDGFLPFADIPVEFGIGGVNPSECVIVS